MPKLNTSKKSEVYKLSLKSMGRVFKSEGKTLEEALGNIKISGGVKAVCVLTVEKGDRKVDKIFNGNYAQKLFGEVSPTMKAIGYAKAKQFIGL